MLSRRWLKPKWIKHVIAQVGSAHPSHWNVTLYLQFKRSFFSFSFYPFSKFLLQSFWELIQHKHNYKIVNESSKGSRLWELERRTSTTTPAAFNITQTRPKLLTTTLWWKPHDPWITTPPSFHLFNVDISLSLST